jgi:membrane protein required for colicin V production
VILGAMRGFVKEATALAGWVVAVILVLNSSAGLGRRLPFEVGSAGVRTAIAAILIVLACVLTAHLLGRWLRAALTAAQLGGPDRALGALFGIARAAAVWLLIALVVVHAGLTQRPFWKSSRLAPLLEAALRLVSPELAPSAPRPLAASGV